MHGNQIYSSLESSTGSGNLDNFTIVFPSQILKQLSHLENPLCQSLHDISKMFRTHYNAACRYTSTYYILEHQAHTCITVFTHSYVILAKTGHLISSLTVLLAIFKHHNFVAIHFYIMAWWWYPMPYYIKSFSVSCVFIQIHLILVHIICLECRTSCLHKI